MPKMSDARRDTMIAAIAIERGRAVTRYSANVGDDETVHANVYQSPPGEGKQNSSATLCVNGSHRRELIL